MAIFTRFVDLRGAEREHQNVMLEKMNEVVTSDLPIGAYDINVRVYG